jgi:hypothetical protein
VQIEHYAYAGQLRSSGLLSRLRARLTQRPLARAVLDALWAELETGRHARELGELVEEAARFTSAVGGHVGARAEMSHEIH